MQSLGIFVVFLLICLVFAFFIVRYRISGGMWCMFLEKHKMIALKLLKVKKDEAEFVMYGGHRYIIKTSMIRLARYPIGWPSFLQQVVPCGLFEIGNGEQLDWIELGKREISSKELGVIVDPYWLAGVIKGTKGEVAVSRWQKMIQLLPVFAMIIVFVLILYLVMKVGQLQSSIDAVRSIIT